MGGTKDRRMFNQNWSKPFHQPSCLFLHLHLWQVDDLSFFYWQWELNLGSADFWDIYLEEIEVFQSSARFEYICRRCGIESLLKFFNRETQQYFLGKPCIFLWGNPAIFYGETLHKIPYILLHKLPYTILTII